MYNNFSNIMVSRDGGTHDSHMKTLDIIGIICPNKYYKIYANNLIESDNNKIINDLSPKNVLDNLEPINTKIYNISQKWKDKDKSICNDSNILGSNGILKLDTDNISIPIAETSLNNLAFYGAILLKNNDTVCFNTKKILPITRMNIGQNYVKHYILNENKGGGCYLEYHDTPHFHMPLKENASGHLILGRTINDICYLSAFKIPYGHAIYTMPYVIHCDCYLVGDYLVVYTITDDYSTVLLKNDDGIVNIKIE